jgi:RND superfamily putative drug exporter
MRNRSHRRHVTRTVACVAASTALGGKSVLTSLARFVLRHRLLVSLFWLAALVGGVAASGKAISRLTLDFSLPGQPGFETEKQLLATYGNSSNQGTTIVSVTSPTGSVTAAQPAVDGVFHAVQQQFPQYRVVWSGNVPADARGRFTTSDGRTTYGLVLDRFADSFTFKFAYQTTKPLLDQQAKASGLQISTTGYNELAAGNSSDSNQGPSLLAETLFGAGMAFLVLLFVFASFMAFVPLVVAAVSIMATFICLLALTYVTDVSFIVQFLVSLVGLGVAIDYSLLLVTRWREELAHGRPNGEAVVEAVRTAGHAVVASAGTVAISLVALVVVPVPFLRSMGLGGLLIPIVSSTVVLTLLPAVLGSIGPRVDWPRIRHEDRASKGWSSWAAMVYRRRWLAAGVGVLLIAALVLPVLGIRIGLARTDALASKGPAVTTLATLHRGGVPAGVVTPLEVLVKGADPAASAAEVVRRASTVDGIAFAAAPTDATWNKGGTSVVAVLPVVETVDLQRAVVVERLQKAVGDVPGVVGIVGNGATVRDYSKAVFGHFPEVIALIALITFVLLVRAFRSLLLPLKAVLLNVLSVAATFGFVVLFWQRGYGSEHVFSIRSTGAVTFWLPVIIFAFLFGLSMDYEVFILTRMREEYDKSGSTRTAVVEGLGRTGRLVTCAALILFLAFIALAGSPGTDIKVLATALGVGILIDATIIRALMVPALVSLLGRWNWWLPSWLARPLRVEPSDAVVELPHQREEQRDAAPVP